MRGEFSMSMFASKADLERAKARAILDAIKAEIEARQKFCFANGMLTRASECAAALAIIERHEKAAP